MNIRHSSTGKRIIQSTYVPDYQNAAHDRLSLESILKKPETKNSEALSKIREKLKQTSNLPFPPEPKFSSSSPKNTFLSIFPHRSSIHTKHSSLFHEKNPDAPFKLYNHRTDSLTSHRDAMIRASNLFKLYIPKGPS